MHSSYVVRLGELDTAREDDGAAPIDILIEKKIKHELYDRSAYTDDIALLVLQMPVTFTGQWAHFKQSFNSFQFNYIVHLSLMLHRMKKANN